MANSREVLETWLNEGKTVPKEMVDSLVLMKGLTDELAEQRFLEKYGKVAPFKDADKINNPSIPSLANLPYSDMNIEDDPKDNPSIKKPRKKEQKFIEDFPKKLKDWKEAIEKNPKYGKRGWETVKEIWQQAMHQKMLNDIAKARHDAVYDNPYAYYASFMWPRAYEHLANTGDFTAKDMLADFGTNLAMSIPGAKFTGLAAKGLGKVAPKVVNYFSGPGRNILEGALKGSGRMAGNIFGNAVVPFASEGMDALIYDENDKGMEHRGDFSLGDALIGTAINQGVNRGLMRLGGPIIDRFSQGGLARGGMMKARQFLEQLGIPFSKRGDDFAQEVAERVANPTIAEKGEATQAGLNFVKHGGDDIALGAQPQEALENAAKAQSVLDAINSGEIKYDPAKGQKMAESAWKVAYNQADAKAQNNLQIAEAKVGEAQSLIDGFVHDGTEEADLMAGALYQNRADAEQQLVEAIAQAEKIKSLGNAKGSPSVENLFNYTGEETFANPSRETLKNVAQQNPAELVNYAAWHGTGDGAVNRTDRILNSLNQAAPAWGINKWGSESDAEMLLSPMPKLKKKLDKERKETHNAPAKRNTARDVLNVVNSTPELTEQDRKYMNAIAANPDILKYGYNDDPNGFKIWLLERGNELLQGTSAFRPTFGVE